VESLQAGDSSKAPAQQVSESGALVMLAAGSRERDRAGGAPQTRAETSRPASNQRLRLHKLVGRAISGAQGSMLKSAVI